MIFIQASASLLGAKHDSARANTELSTASTGADALLHKVYADEGPLSRRRAWKRYTGRLQALTGMFASAGYATERNSGCFHHLRDPFR